MKAIVRRRYGPPDVLGLDEVDAPVASDDAILVRVRASSVNAYDWHMMRGLPYVARLSEGLRVPKSPAMGLDAAGEVVAVGESVPHVRRGDRVFGSRNGAFAELVAGRTFVTMPANLSFEEAAALPTVGYTALQALRDKGALRAGQRVLVIGAGGGVGSVAVQIAKSLGGTVTGVTSRAKADMVRSLGADDVLEHGELRLRRRVRPFDLIIDIASDRSLRELSELLTTTGTLVMVGPGRGNWAGPLMRIGAAVVRSRIGTRRIEPFLAKPNRDDLVVLRDLAESGALRPVIDSTYPLSDVADAIRRVESGQACGKVVITV